MDWLTLLGAVALGGALGGVARYLVSTVVGNRTGHAAWGTLTVNVTGALAIGILAGMMLDASGTTALPPTGWLFLVTGLVGSYTTVSSFALQSMELFETGQTGAALLNIVGSIALCILATGTGLLLAGGFGL